MIPNLIWYIKEVLLNIFLLDVDKNINLIWIRTPNLNWNLALYKYLWFIINTFFYHLL